MRCALTVLSLALCVAAPAASAQDVAPTAALRLSDYSALTPTSIPGARVIETSELRSLMQAPVERRPFLFDVRGERRESLPGAIWLPGAGRGTSFDDAIQPRLAAVLNDATQGDKARSIVFFCAGPRCWLSYNASLRAAKLGYTNVRWYREGTEVWGEGGGAMTEPRVAWKPPAG